MTRIESTSGHWVELRRVQIRGEKYIKINTGFKTLESGVAYLDVSAGFELLNTITKEVHTLVESPLKIVFDEIDYQSNAS